MANRKTFWMGITFLLPISIMIFIFIVIPIIQTLYYSFTNWTGIGGYEFIGFDNYRIIFDDSSFIKSIKVTLFIGFAIAILTNIFGMIFALMVNRKLKTKNLSRVLLYIPKLLPIVLAAFVWRYILETHDGLVNNLLSDLLGKSVHIPWVDSPSYVVFTIIMISVWQLTGPIFIVYLATLQIVPHEIKESSVVDGASPVRQFFSIILPMMAPGITVNTLIGLATGLKLFDLPFALTGGGPANASKTLAIRIYQNAFDSNEIAFGMASAFVLTMFVLVITLVFVVVTKRYEGRAYE